MDDNAAVSDFKNFEIILQGLADCVASHGGGLLVSLLAKTLILSIIHFDISAFEYIVM